MTGVRNAIRRFRLHGYKEAAPVANSPQGMVNVAHHAEVAILDDYALTTPQEFPGTAAQARVPRQTARDIRNTMSILLTPRD